MGSQLRHSDIGAWVFKCNPKEWDIEAGLRAGAQIDSWRLHESYRVDLIEAGDPAIIWVTGSAKATPTPGIRAVGYTTGEIFDGHGDEHWVRKRSGQQRARFAGLVIWPIRVIPREQIAAEPDTAEIEILRQPQMSNPSYLTPKQYRVVAAMVDQWPSYS